MKHIIFLSILIAKFCTCYGQNSIAPYSVKKSSISIDIGAGIVHHSYSEAQPLWSKVIKISGASVSLVPS